jgi:hypothetical protein
MRRTLFAGALGLAVGLLGPGAVVGQQGIASSVHGQPASPPAGRSSNADR